MEGVRELTRRHGIVFIADEVMAGFGRSGKWFAIDHWDVVPDLLTFAKGVNSGYVPLGGVAVSDAIFETFRERAYPGGLTYSGHPLACAAAVATIDAMQEEGIVENAARLGAEVIGPRLRELAAKHPSVGEVRGAGCFWAVELVKNRHHPRTAGRLRRVLAGDEPGRRRAEGRGLLPFANFNRIHVVPALNIPDELLLEALDALDRALDVADGFVED